MSTEDRGKEYEIILEQAQDMQYAMYWVHELQNPCHPKDYPELHVGDTYLREAKRLLSQFEDKPVERQNPRAMDLLRREIKAYEERNKDRFKDREDK